MNDEDDYARDGFISELYSDFARDVLAGQDDLYGQVVDKFAMERLQAYYGADGLTDSGRSGAGLTQNEHKQGEVSEKCPSTRSLPGRATTM